MRNAIATLLEFARVCSCSILVLSFASSLVAQSRPPAKRPSKPDFTSARKLIQERMVADSLPSVSVAVVRKGEILWQEGFGWADRENRIPATEHTMYYLASVTKSITATAVMVLNDRKQLDLEQPVNDYLGSAKVSSPVWDPARATVRRVATHTAGLTTYARSCYRGPQDCRISADETIQRYGILFWPPGDHFDYSNLGYGILGAVVAQVSGKSYADFLRSELFWPLGMTHASLGIDPSLKKYTASRYSNELGLRPTAISGTPGASAVYCSAHDLAMFGMFQLKAHLPSQKAILSDASLDAMKESTSEQYGFGWWINKDLFGYRSVMGQGGTDDASATLQLIPSEEIAVVVLANTGTTLPSAVVNEVLSTLLPPYRERRAKAEPAKPPEGPKNNLPSPALIGAWTGMIRTYRGNIPLTFSISSSGEVQAKLGSQLRTLLNNARFSKESLTGLMSGDLGTVEDTGVDPYDLDFELYLRDGAINGSVTTRPHAGGRNFARLPYWVELKKERDAIR
jgi:CubicO group peptidase (beta-lactamase class C family)